MRDFISGQSVIWNREEIGTFIVGDGHGRGIVHSPKNGQTLVYLDNLQPYLTWEECEQRFPRLVKAMQWVACLNSLEAAAALRDWRMGLGWSSEAVNHYGGIRKVLENAVKLRHSLPK